MLHAACCCDTSIRLPLQAQMKPAGLLTSAVLVDQGEQCYRRFRDWREGDPLPCPLPLDANRPCDCSGLLALGQECLQAASDWYAELVGTNAAAEQIAQVMYAGG